jgi:hypothetical protein
MALVEGLLVMLWTVSISADPKNALVAGLSLYRLVLLGIAGLGILTISMTLVVSIRNQRLGKLISNWIETMAWGKLIGLVGFALMLILLIPGIDWGKWFAAQERIRPLLTWFCLLTLQWFALGIAARGRTATLVKEWVIKRIVPSRRAILVGMILLTSSYVLSTILYPMGNKGLYWWETGVPILGWQLILSAAIGLIYYQFDGQIFRKLGKKTDIILFLLIFISCGFLWGSSRLHSSYFNPGPFLPNNVFYPYSDAAKFDIYGQSTLVGLGFNSGFPLDRPFYPMFLAIIHLISGQNYANNMIFQAFLFGIFPALVYLICSEIGSRSWGVMTSSAIGLLGFNAIEASNLLTSSNPKQMMTEFPLAIALSLVLYFTIRWLKSKGHSGIYACIVGGLLAASAFVRYAALPLLPIWVIVAIIKYRPTYKKGLIEASLIVVSFLAFTAPWYTRNILAGQNPSIPFSSKILFVIHHRYEPAPGSKQNEKTATPTVGTNDFFQPTTTVLGNDEIISLPSKNNNSNQPSDNFLYWFPPHLVHNLMSSILILPTSLEMASLKTSLDFGGEIWQPGWNGSLPLFRLLILFLQLFILSAGLAALLRRDKSIAAIVILIFGGVQTANALGRSSGGRYIVPVDWVVLLIYFAGLLFFLGKLDINDKFGGGNVTGKFIGWRSVAVMVIGILFIGALPVFFERISIALNPRPENIQSVEELASLPGINISPQDISEIGLFLNQQRTIILHGTAFYPVEQNKKDLSNLSSPLTNNYQGTTLSFSLLQSRNYLDTIYFPFQGVLDLQNQDEVYLVGCRSNQLIIVKDLFIIKANRTMFLKSDFSFDTCKPVESTH